MRLPHRVFAGLLAVVAATTLLAASASRQATHTPRASTDSVTVRVLYKVWGRGFSPQAPWDSLTLRLAERDPLLLDVGFPNHVFRLGKIISPHSAWLLYRPAAVTAADRGPTGSIPADWDSTLIGTQPLGFSTSSADGGVSYLLKIISRRGTTSHRAVPTRTASLRPPASPDSATLRVMYRVWGGELEQCTGMNWGWDSLTWRLAPRMSVGGNFLYARFTLGRIISPDSAWLIYPMRELGLNGRSSDPRSSPEFDSVIVSSRPIAFETINLDDAKTWFRVKLVTPWPEPVPKSVKTTAVRGRVVDDSTGCAVFFCQVVVDGTKCSAYTDTLGAFLLSNVPVGDRELHACCPGYVGGHVALRAPSESLVIRLRRDPRLSFSRPCR